jgi:hypothetical protein
MIFALNRLDCNLTASAFEQNMMLFFANDPKDRDRLDKLIIRNRGVIPEGLRIVPNTERYSPNQEIVGSAMSNLQNNINQNSSSFTNDAASQAGGKDNQTLGEWSGKLSLYNQMVSATLELAYRYQAHQYREIFRRFCIKNSTDEDVQDYQSKCIKAGIPKEMIYDSKRWEIIPERVMGGGNRALAVQEAQAIYAIRPSLSPQGQVQAAHNLVMAISNDPDMADDLVDLESLPKANNTVQGTEALFGTIMEGIMPKDSGIADHISVIETMLGMMNAKIMGYQKRGGMAPMDKIEGLQTASQFTARHIKMLAQDPLEKAKVKEYGDALKQMDNQIKAFMQRAQQAMQAQQAQQGADGQQADMLKAASQAKIKEAGAQQKQQHKQIDFTAKQKRADMSLAADLSSKQEMAKSDLAIQEAKGILALQKPKAGSESE